MKQLLQLTALCVSMVLGTAQAQETAGNTAPAMTAEEAPAAVESTTAVQPEESGARAKGPRLTVSLDNDDGDGEDESRLERKIKSKVADVLEAALMDDDLLSKKDQKELKEALAELRSEIDSDESEAESGGSSTADSAETDTEAKAPSGHVGHEDSESGHLIRVQSNDSDVPAGAMVLGGMAILLIFGTPVMLVAAVLYWGYRKRRLAHDTINQYLASGKEIPEEVMQNLFKDTKPKNNLHKGMVMCGLGFGIFLCFAIIGSMEAASFGMIFLFIGLAQLLIWKLEKDGNGQRGRE